MGNTSLEMVQLRTRLRQSTSPTNEIHHRTSQESFKLGYPETSTCRFTYLGFTLRRTSVSVPGWWLADSGQLSGTDYRCF